MPYLNRIGASHLSPPRTPLRASPPRFASRIKRCGTLQGIRGLASAGTESVYSSGIVRLHRLAPFRVGPPMSWRGCCDGDEDVGRLARRGEIWSGGRSRLGPCIPPAGLLCPRRTLRRNSRPTAWVRPTGSMARTTPQGRASVSPWRHMDYRLFGMAPAVPAEGLRLSFFSHPSRGARSRASGGRYRPRTG
jgi:hypothetical protein